MTMRKLADPILNDLLLMLQGRRLADLSPAAISRYLKHLDRIDTELAAARQASGQPALSVTDDIATVSKQELEKLRAIADSPVTYREVVIHDTRANDALQQFSDALLVEFRDDLAVTTAPDACTASLELLRAFKARLAAAEAEYAGAEKAQIAADFVEQTSAQPSPKGTGTNRRTR